MTDDFRGRVLVLGGRGMLGRAVADAARAVKYQVWAPDHFADVTNPVIMHSLEHELTPHTVVNCAGVIPIRRGERSDVDMIRVNALGPWVVRDAFPHSHIVQVSTDCVFDGRNHPYPYGWDEPPNARDLYGRSKAMGEPSGVIVVRTSFIGLEHGLVKWLLDQRDGVIIEGWVNALWTGATVWDVAEALVELFSADSGIYHLATDAISKGVLLNELADLFDLDVRIAPKAEPVLNRALHANVALTRRLERLVEHSPVAMKP